MGAAALSLAGCCPVWASNIDVVVNIASVKPGDRIGSMWVIDEGLKPGDRVVAEGVQKVSPGVTVVPQQSPAQSSKKK